MLRTIALILLVLWLAGMIFGQALGAVVHLVLVIALILFVVSLVTGKKV